MSLLANEEFSYNNSSLCHVCHKPVDLADTAVQHDGTVSIRDRETYGHILMHTPCAAILGMRLLHDVMRDRSPERVVNILSAHVKEQVYGN